METIPTKAVALKRLEFFRSTLGFFLPGTGGCPGCSLLSLDSGLPSGSELYHGPVRLYSSRTTRWREYSRCEVEGEGLLLSARLSFLNVTRFHLRGPLRCGVSLRSFLLCWMTRGCPEVLEEPHPLLLPLTWLQVQLWGLVGSAALNMLSWLFPCSQ